ncbi:hypothetical protein K2X83_01180 [Patescibacteria group bacterium]|nr:hypothetical protein [Patescibacteria group bacterium]
MEWATKRQLFYALIVLGVLLVAVVVLWFAFFYRAPTCSDGKMNQNEEGVDCGGKCSKVCESPAVSALWARSVKVADGVYHAVAMVRNPATDAGTTNLPYTFYLYDVDNILVAQRSGSMILEPGETVPLLETNIVTRERTPTKTFVEFGQALWRERNRTQSPVVIDSEVLDTENLRLTARVSNTTPTLIPKVILTALVYGKEEVVIAASQTVLGEIPPRGEAEAVFTWQEPFPEDVVRTVITSRTR